MATASIDEIFASVQGEGPFVGQRHIFVRFVGCDLRCAYCDTPEAVKAASDVPFCRAQRSPESFDRELVENPLTPEVLSGLCRRLELPKSHSPIISLTGGEPLLSVPFLKEWLPTMQGNHRIYLETNGIGHEAMKEISHLVDLVSMDIKLPSATRQAAQWERHRAFLEAAPRGKLFVKTVITRETSESDVLQAATLVGEYDRAVIFVLQPASGSNGPAMDALLGLQRTILPVLQDVRIVPQVHKLLQVP